MNDILQSENGEQKLYSAIDKQFLSIVDKTTSFQKNLTEDFTKDPFYKARIESLENKNRPIHSKGQVGYGAFYDATFKTNFDTGACIEHLIICPDNAGGDLNNFLYLTSTNRTSKGVEAFISYYKQDKFSLKVFDWAQTDHWQIDINRDKLSDYLTSKSVNGGMYQVIHIVNLTYQTENNKWINDVYLKNLKTNKLDVVYRYEYTATVADQKDTSVYVGSWGPIIETFQSSHNKINTIGFVDTHVSSRGSDNKWSKWQTLENTISSIRNDGTGFNASYLVPNHTFIS